MKLNSKPELQTLFDSITQLSKRTVKKAVKLLNIFKKKKMLKLKKKTCHSRLTTSALH